MKPDVLVLAVFAPEKMAQLEERYTVHHLLPEPAPDIVPAAVAEAVPADALARVRALATDPGRGASKALMDLLPKLEIVSSVGVGLDTFDLPEARRRGIPVTNTPDILTNDVADLAIALMIASSRRMFAAERFLREGRWLSNEPPLSRSVNGKTLGILGLGRIGMAIARRAEAFGLTILYTGTGAKPGVPYGYCASPAELAERSDFLAVSCKGGSDTAGLVDATTLDALGPEGTLINVARGSVVDEPAMIAALREGRLGFAALDVFASEPDVSKALLALPNVIVQPHHGSGTIETRNNMAQLVIDNLAAHFDGKPLLTPVG